MKKTSKTMSNSGRSSNKIVFFGTGPVAARSLELLAHNFDIEAVITKPKPVHHRGSYPVIKTAESLKIPLLYVQNKQQLDDLLSKKPVKSQIAVLIDFGIIVSKHVIDYFPLGIVNSHFSLLPEWRGADPITFSILSGQLKTGVSIMLIDEGMDTGKLLAQKSLTIELDETASSLTDKLIVLSNDLLFSTLPKYIKGDITPRQQPHPERATYSRKLTKNDGTIDWSLPAEQIERQVRAFHSWPKSTTTLANKDVIVTSCHITELELPAGSVEIIDKQLVVGCGENSLVIDSLKPAGKQEMTGEAFIAGHRNQLSA